MNLFQLVASLYKEIASLGTYKTQFSGTVAEALFNRGGSVAWHIIVLRLSHSENALKYNTVIEAGISISFNEVHPANAPSPIVCNFEFCPNDTVSKLVHIKYLQPIITQYFIDNKSEIWLLFLIAHSKR